MNFKALQIIKTTIMKVGQHYVSQYHNTGKVDTEQPNKK